jgi:putative Ca2+/H+ antiporter (TMEM165/GDT1 family)
MDWKVFAATFTAIFFAELADKTQLVGIGMSAETRKPLTVLAGSVCGYILVTSLSVFLGAILSKYIGAGMIRYVGATMFIIIGVLMFAGKI